MSWIKICGLDALVANTGMGAIVNGQQLALFYVPTQDPAVFALDNWDPIGKAYVMARGIVGDLKGELCVASPLYKQHFNLRTGQCLEQPAISLATWSVKVEDGSIWVKS
ncbi:nitrite reductase small subunit NirD [Photobacterium ganghwense]|uniref:nitrite reductase small subunit NirD n=1 Tax=Photobacterium ganghwense TaxID=320778 RepID=UPI0039F0B046